MKFTIASTLLALACSIAPTVLAAPLGSYATHGVANSTGGADDTPGSAGNWTVIVDKDDPRSLEELIKEMGDMNIYQIYNNTAFKGFTGSLSSAGVSRMSVMSGIKTFEPDIEVSISDVQTNAPWGLQRISQGSVISDAPTDDASVAAFDFKFQFEGGTSEQGKGVDIYIIDTGVNVKHVDFDGRATVGFDIDGTGDQQGHGTHCAGTAASTTFGIAKNANIISVKVLKGDNGQTSDILLGIDWMIRNHEKRQKEDGFKGSVASMSLGSGTRSPPLDEAVKQASANGIHFSVAAGNENQKACNSSPAFASSVSNAIAVGATTIIDQRAGFSNFGDCTTLYAPGQDVTSTWIGGDNKINTISGTSMACPHVSGLIAALLSQHQELRTNTKGMKELLLGTALHLDIDKGTVRIANNGFKSTAGKMMSKRMFERV